jgi:hypothetical protein
MAKIHSYYLSNMKNELSYISQQCTNEELYKMIDNSTFLQFEDEDDEVDDEIKSPALEIPTHEVQVLIIESFFGLKDTVKGLDNDDENSDESDINSDNNSDDSSNNDSESKMKSDYDVEELAQQHLLEDDLVGNTL